MTGIPLSQNTTPQDDAPEDQAPQDGAPEVEAPRADTPQDDAPGLRSLVTYSLFVGLCGLIPIPFLDDWASKVLRRRSVLHLCKAQSVPVSDDEVEMLAHGDPNFELQGCLKGCFLGAFMRTALYVVRKIFTKIFRTLLFFLTVRDVLNSFSRSFHEGYLLRHSLALGVLPQGEASAYPKPMQESLRPQVISLRQAIERAYKASDHGPLTRVARTVLAGSRGMLRHLRRSLTSLLRRLRRRGASDATVEEQLRQESEAKLGGLIDSLTREISKETGYLELQRKTLEEALGLAAVPSESSF